MSAGARGLRGWAAVAALAACLSGPGRAHAHHAVGHGSSEGVRSINSLGSRGGAASTRLMLLNEFSHAGRGLVPGQRYELTLLGEYAPRPSFSLGLQLPLTVLAEQPAEGEARTSVGYGDTRVFVRVTPYADKLIHRTLTLAASASFPTRTVGASVDAGRSWTLSPSLIFTRTYATLYWQALALASVEWRPAGVALDTSAGAQVGGRFFDGELALGGGLLLDLRAVNGCRSVSGELSYCAGNRAGEQAREVGSTRANAVAGFAWSFNATGALTFGLQVPVTRRRDFDVGASAGVQVVF